MILHKYKCIFIRIPKVASTSIDGYFVEYLEGTPGEFVQSPHITREEGVARTINLFPTYWIFTFVRNPFDRFVSFWVHRFDHTRVGGGKVGKVRYHTFHEYAELAVDLFNHTTPNPQSLKEIGPHRVNSEFLNFDKGHLSPQENYLLDHNPKFYFGVKRINDVGCSFIGRYENLAEDFACLLDILGAPHYPMLQKNISNTRVS